MTVNRRRSPTLATWLSILPGLGQAYNGEMRKAAFFPVSTAVTLAVAIVVISSGDQLSRVHIGAVAALFVGLLAVILFIGLFILGLAFWASAAVDARRSARHLSEGTASPDRWWLLRF